MILAQALFPMQNLYFAVKTTTTTLRRFTVGPLFAEMTQNMEMGVCGAPAASWTQSDLELYHFRPAKLYGFAAHDVTIAAILNSLDLWDGDWPQYMSALILELHCSLGNSTAEKDYTLKVNFIGYSS